MSSVDCRTSTLPRSNYGLIVAAGRGSRYGRYKQFISLAGRPVLIHSVKAFERCAPISGIVVVAPVRRLEFARRMLRAFAVRKLLAVVPGGDTRAESVRAGLTALPTSGYVAVHDSARPLINAGMLSKGLRACRGRGAATYGYAVTDTLKRVEDDSVLATVKRTNLIAVQTPQFFRIELLRRAHSCALHVRSEPTDDCELVERLGVHPAWIPGPRTNLKITTREDLEILRGLV